MTAPHSGSERHSWPAVTRSGELAAPAHRRRPSARGLEQELLTINFGPHHPATHGVLRLLVTLQGEVVRDVRPYVGYVHTGIEKTARTSRTGR